MLTFRAQKNGANASVNSSDNSVDDDTSFMLTYMAWVLSSFVISVIQTLVFCFSVLYSSTKLHNAMFAALLASPVRFFDTNPTGILS